VVGLTLLFLSYKEAVIVQT